MAARTATLKKSVSTLAHGGVFTITTGELQVAVPGATIADDVIQPQDLTIYANGGETACSTTIVTGALRVVWDGGANQEDLPAGDLYIDINLLDTADVTSLDDNSTGAIGASLIECPATYDAAIVNANVATLNAKLDEVITALNGLV